MATKVTARPSPEQLQEGKDETPSQRAARLRDNKRRNRQKQKDYTTSLETQLRELQLQGVHATKEVQVSARRVVEENARLKALLRHVGVSDHMIETWVPDAIDTAPPRLSECSARGSGRCDREDRSSSTSCLKVQAFATTSATQDAVPSVLTRCAEVALPIQEIGPDAVNQEMSDLPQTGFISSPSSASTLQLPPCQILSRLAEDPTTDVTQTNSDDWESGEPENGGVECSQAHKLLMQFATTEEKLDVVSKALERGCVKKAGGGCKVKNEALWKAIDAVT